MKCQSIQIFETAHFSIWTCIETLQEAAACICVTQSSDEASLQLLLTQVVVATVSRGGGNKVQTGVSALIKEVPLSLSLSLPDTLEQSKTHNPSAAAGGAAERKAFWPGNLQQAAFSPRLQHVLVCVRVCVVHTLTFEESQLVLDVRF